ncbi:ABC transporter substrate-binding protein [Actinoplanes sichuanensis]|uniref:ABC transporter substrate-binding protein n=1 Tax=Actinoplanes sichuanensis TaxID=512349 RepID=A0ABW4AC71_9ACTN|nr:ABC transporter substrate-binding protein [Actinoplanes sichuanensis]BEL10161.1 ABC transporter substrate-binding protein [Actinoplanes sichuanensis]
MRLLRYGIAVLGVAALLGVGGCARAEMAAEAGQLDEVAAVTRDDALHNLLPDEIKARGFIRLVTDASYAPMEYFAADGRTIIGFEPDLAAAIGQVLGIRVEMVVGTFSTAVDEVNAGTYDGVLSSMTDTVERRGRVDFINYFSTGSSILVQRGNPQKIGGLRDLCGQAAATEKGTYHEEMLLRIQSECGDRKLTVHSLPTNADAMVELRGGRVAAVLQDYPPAAFVTTDQRTSAFYELATDEQYEPGLFGLAVDRDNDELRDCLRDALQRLIDSGVYNDLLARWELTASGVKAATINAG